MNDNPKRSDEYDGSAPRFTVKKQGRKDGGKRRGPAIRAIDSGGVRLAGCAWRGALFGVVLARVRVRFDLMNRAKHALIGQRNKHDAGGLGGGLGLWFGRWWRSLLGGFWMAAFLTWQISQGVFVFGSETLVLGTVFRGMTAFCACEVFVCEAVFWEEVAKMARRALRGGKLRVGGGLGRHMGRGVILEVVDRKRVARLDGSKRGCGRLGRVRPSLEEDLAPAGCAPAFSNFSNFSNSFSNFIDLGWKGVRLMR